MDIYVRIVDKYARFHIASGINVQVTAASGDTSANILSIILEVHGEDRLGVV